MGLFDKIRQGLKKTTTGISGTFASLTKINDDFFDDLEDTLIMADVGVGVTTDAVENLRKLARNENLRGAEDLKKALGAMLLAEMPESGELNMDSPPAIILVIGVNGVGKTTTIGKLAYQLRNSGKNVLLVAGDTFRAAAGEQLDIWAQRSGCDIIQHADGADPASVIYDGLNAARARGSDVVICDTAGRLHNKSNLMNELNKVSRVIDKTLPNSSKETLLVLDATTGQNGLNQAKQFKEAAGITGIVLTKLDGTAKGGIVISIGRELGVPVKYIGVGEGIDDLIPFNAAEFVDALLGE